MYANFLVEFLVMKWFSDPVRKKQIEKLIELKIINKKQTFSLLIEYCRSNAEELKNFESEWMDGVSASHNKP